MARNKDPLFKARLWAMRKKRLRAPVWTFLKARKRIFPRFSKINWRRTDFGRRIRV